MNDNQNDQKLRQWSINKAIEAGSGIEAVKVADTIYRFVTGTQNTKADSGETLKKHWSPHTLTLTQKAIQTKAIELNRADRKVNGAIIARELKMHQSQVSAELVKMVKNLYIRREGNKFTPLLTPSGEPLPVAETKLPAMASVGYKGSMSNPMGTVARIK